MNDYLNTADQIIDFLYWNQVIAENQQLLFKPFQCGYRAEFCSRFIRKDNIEYVIPLYLLSGEEGTYLTDSLTDRKAKVCEGSIFRISPKGISHGISSAEIVSPSLLQSFRSKGKDIGYLSLLRKIYWTFCNNLGKTGYLDFALRYALRKHLSTVHDLGKRLEDCPGISFIFEKPEKVREGTRVTLKSYDLGGIYDDNLNSEGKYYPPQVPGNYYADAYAAWCFLNRYERQKNRKFRDAGLLALDFIKRTYPCYQAANIVWHHSDFKNPAIIESICEILPKVAPEKEEQYTQLLGRLKQDSYEPTNVYALRLHTYAAEKCYGIKRNILNQWIAINRLKKDQTKEGLIKDILPGYHEDARDLTYHQYMMACISRSISLKYYRNLEKIFIKGVRFSLSLLTPDGEVAYLGRCANNVYLGASAIYAFEFGSTLKGIDEKERGQYKRAARLILAYMKPWQRPDGDFPTALNDQFERRMGWSHCRTPYNALSAYFLCRAASVHQKDLSEYPVPMEGQEGDYFRYFEESGYVAYSNGNYYVVLFSGGEPSYWWSQGAHRCGWMGIAILGIPGSGSLTGSLSESIGMRKIKANALFGRAQIKLRSNEIKYYKDNKFVGSYRFSKQSISFSSGDNEKSYFFIKSGVKCHENGRCIQGLFRLPGENRTLRTVGVFPNPNGIIDLLEISANK